MPRLALVLAGLLIALESPAPAAAAARLPAVDAAFAADDSAAWAASKRHCWTHAPPPGAAVRPEQVSKWCRFENLYLVGGRAYFLRSSEGERVWRVVGDRWVQPLQRGGRSLPSSPAVLALLAADKDVHFAAFDRKRNIPASITGDQLRELVPAAAPRVIVPIAHLHPRGCCKGRREVHAWVPGEALPGAAAAGTRASAAQRSTEHAGGRCSRMRAG